MVRSAAVRLFWERGFDVRQVWRDVSAYDDDGRFVMEIDLLVLNADAAIAIECKSHCSVEDVSEHLDRLSGFKACFPQYADFRGFGAMASMIMPEETAHYAYQGCMYYPKAGTRF